MKENFLEMLICQPTAKVLLWSWIWMTYNTAQVSLCLTLSIQLFACVHMDWEVDGLPSSYDLMISKHKDWLVELKFGINIWMKTKMIRQRRNSKIRVSHHQQRKSLKKSWLRRDNLQQTQMNQLFLIWYVQNRYLRLLCMKMISALLSKMSIQLLRVTSWWYQILNINRGLVNFNLPKKGKMKES